MKILKYEDIKNIFNKKIFENSRIDLLTKLSKYPERYIGLFRPTKPKTKIIQNITQSHEIKFGDAFELLIRILFETSDYKTLSLVDKDGDGNTLNYDQLFLFNNEIIFIEQKVRDDHDSTKKRGQMENFEKKLNILIEKYDKKIRSYFYFIDPSLKKNKNFYLEELGKISSSYGLTAELCYGQELFDFERLNVWDEEIISFLERWRNELPDMPEINFDLDQENTINELSDLKPLVYRKLFDNPELVKIIFPIIFPNKIVLMRLLEVFQSKIEEGGNTVNIYTSLKVKLEDVIQSY
jgi:hypothetical protein